MRKAAVVTGASRGIGRACAIRLAEEGFDIVVNYNKSKKEAEEVADIIKGMGREAILFRADVSNSEEVKKLFDYCMDEFGQIDALVNNAGIVNDTYLMMLSDLSLDRSLETNLKSCFYCCRQGAIKMFRNKRGKIVNISSISSIKGIPGQSVYSATKGAINSLTKVLAMELAQFGIQVNAVAPGFIDTDMMNNIPEEQKNAYIDLIPQKRFGKADEVAEIVCFLCKNGSDYITGQVIGIDGGLSI